jgi:enediyne biosynthesis protein E4
MQIKWSFLVLFPFITFMGCPEDPPDEPKGPQLGNCEVQELSTPGTQFFVEISVASGIQEDNYDETREDIPINDHSRLAFADINGDGYDDMVFHSLFPNPQAGIPFEHLVFVNNKDGTFTNFSDDSGLRDVQSAFFAFGDVDNDGDQDVFSGMDFAISGHTNQILLNDGEGHFTPKASSGVESVIGAVANAIFADFNGDAKQDLFIGIGSTLAAQPDKFFLGNGDGTFTDESSRMPNMPNQPSNGSVACDYDNDGDLDIFVSTYSISTSNGVNALWENDGGNFTNVALGKGFASQATGNPFGSASANNAEEPGRDASSYTGNNGFGIDCDDINNDGNLDIFMTAISHPDSRQWGDPTHILINQGKTGDYAFVSETTTRNYPYNEGDVDGATIDFDNDGRMDFSVSRDKKYEKNYTGIEQKAYFGLMHQQKDGSVVNLGPDSGINRIDEAASASQTDCTNDSVCPEGEACLPLVANTRRCRNPCETRSDCPAEELCHAKGFCKHFVRTKNAQNHAWADIDRDGDLDLLVGGRDTGGGRPNFLFRNDIGSKNRWLAIEIEGDGSNVTSDALGTRVSIQFDDETLMQEKKSGRGMYNSEDTRTLHFGLGDRDCNYTIEVRWPDGTTASFNPDQVAENSFMRLTYPDKLQAQ